MDREVRDLYAEYRRDEIDRRQFLAKLTAIAGGVAAAYALLPLLEGGAVRAAIVPADDTRLMTEPASFPGETGEIRGYLARPTGGGKLPGVIVVHENRGLNSHIEDVTRRIALAGFLTLAPDALSPMGGSPVDPEQAIEMIRKLNMDDTVKNFVAAAAYLKTHPQSTGKVGVVGFCWGGAMANLLAVHSPDIVAAVPYYGRPPEAEDVGKIKASLLLHYAGNDERINKDIPAFKEALNKNNVDFQLYMYEGAEHAFNNDTNPERYNKEAAELAWTRTMDFLNRKLKG